MYIELYLQGKSLRKIEELTGIPRKRVSRLLKEAGHEVKARSKGTTGKRKYALNENIFEVIDTEEKAYWLGFLYADGYVGFNKLELALGIKDKQHLEKFQKFMGTDAPITERVIGNSTSCRINICSNKLLSDLEKHGCTQAKSMTLTFPELPEELTHHFMRGYFDGDGCCYIRKDGSPVWSLVGTESFLESYQDILVGLGANKNPKRHGNCGEAWEIRYGGKNIVTTISQFLYKDATIYLERKLKTAV